MRRDHKNPHICGVDRAGLIIAAVGARFTTMLRTTRPPDLSHAQVLAVIGMSSSRAG